MMSGLKKKSGRRSATRGALMLPTLALLYGLLYSVPPASEEAARYFVLDNGLKVFLLEKRNVPLVNVAAAVNLGSKDETPETSGSVHILEHYIL